jgi:hypothetical protein
VLAGRTDVDVESLLELIHRVNPTERELPAAVAAQRYEIKSRLQSLLLRRFAESLKIEPASDDHRLISISHRFGPGDACHAVVEDLDVDVRAELRRRLDEQLHELEERAVASTEPSWEQDTEKSFQDTEHSATELVRRGRTALEAYDYDESRRLLDEAVQLSGGSAESALPLLELLVDHLGLAQDALALEPRLTEETRTNPQVRIMLALAAAQLADHEKATQLVRGLDSPRAGEAYLILADQAIRSGEEDVAGQCLELARQHEAAPFELSRLDEALAKLRAVRLEPEEEKLRQLQGQDRLAEAEALAGDLLQRWPESRVARSILQAAERRRQVSRAQELLERAERAIETGSLSTAAALMREALALDQEQAAELEPRIGWLEQEDRRRQQDAAVERVCSLLAGDQCEAGMHEYLGLAREPRERVRQAIDQPTLAWLEQAAESSSPGARARAVAAVLALERAAQSNDHQKVITLLAPHQRALRNVDEAARVLARAEAGLRKEQQAAARRSLELARAALSDGQLDQATSLLAGADLRILPAAERPAAQELVSDLKRAEDAARVAARVDELAAAGEPLAACDHARKMLTLCRENEIPIWERRCRELSASVHRHFHLQVTDLAGSDSEILLRNLAPYRDDGIQIWISGRDRLVLAVGWSRQVFIWIVDTDSGCLETCVMLRTPESLGQQIDALVEADALHITGFSGWQLVLSLADWEVLSWKPPVDDLEEEERLLRRRLMPGGRYLWRMSELDDLDDLEAQVCIVDLENRMVCRSIHGPHHLQPVICRNQRLVLACEEDCTTTALTTRGVPATWPKSLPDSTGAAAAHPGKEGLLLVTVPDQWHEGDDQVPVALAGLVKGEEDHSETLEIEGLGINRIHSLATSLDVGMSYLLFYAYTGHVELAGFCWSPDQGLHQVYRVPATSGMIIVQDSESRQTALITSESDFQVFVLDKEPPPVDPEESVTPHLLPTLDTEYCGPFDSESRSLHQQLIIELKNPLKRASLTSAYQSRWENDSERLSDLIYCLSEAGAESAAQQVARQAWHRFEGDPAIAMAYAELELAAEKWLTARQLLEKVDIKQMNKAHLRHLHHLLGKAHYCAGETDTAAAIWLRGASYEGHCPLDLLIELAEPIAEHPGPADWSPELPQMQRLRALIRAADQCTGEPERVLDLLDRPWIWAAREMQIITRIVAAHQAIDAATPWQRFNQQAAFTAFLKLRMTAGIWGKGLPLPDTPWTATEIDRLAEEIMERLGESYDLDDLDPDMEALF